MKVCDEAPKAYQASCAEGAVGILVNNYGSTKPVAPLCETVFSRYEAQCKQIISSKLQFAQFE